MSKLGRPRALDEHKRSTAKFLRGIGLPMKAIARWLKVNPSTLRREMQREPGFRQGMHSARDGLETELLECFVGAAQKKPAAASWLRNHYLRIIEGQERLLRGLKHKQPPTSGSASARKSRRTDRSPASPALQNTDKIPAEQDSVTCQSQSPFSHNAQNAANPTAQNSSLGPMHKAAWRRTSENL
jgi:hypothetical protein